MKRRQLWWSALAIVIVACSKENDDTSTHVANSSVSSAGNGAQGGSAAQAGAASNVKMQCGGATCVVNISLLAVNLTAEACCTSDDKCGQTNSEGTCLEQNAAGVTDAKCPDIHVTALGMDFVQPGCCTPKGECGGLFDQVGWGCVPRATVLADMGGPLEALPCGGN